MKNKQNIKYCMILLVVLFQSYVKLYSQGLDYISFGLKLGYQIPYFKSIENIPNNSKSGFVYGFEISTVSNIQTNLRYGYLLNYEYCKGRSKVHLGVEGLGAGLGMDFGPTLYFDKYDTYLGYSIASFVGLILLPYYEYSHFPSSNLKIEQYGAFVKTNYSIENGKIRSILFKGN